MICMICPVGILGTKAEAGYMAVSRCIHLYDGKNVAHIIISIKMMIIYIII
ncbi:hypothetical protein Trichorick_01674 (plasmid) [Candidatus Trichorickettsia mobilis]|nr:hypothetical protein Trichorick_01674 [Candidatus Trichorickettsia mobilis]